MLIEHSFFSSLTSIKNELFCLYNAVRCLVSTRFVLPLYNKFWWWFLFISTVYLEELKLSVSFKSFISGISNEHFSLTMRLKLSWMNLKYQQDVGGNMFPLPNQDRGCLIQMWRGCPGPQLRYSTFSCYFPAALGLDPVMANSGRTSLDDKDFFLFPPLSYFQKL